MAAVRHLELIFDNSGPPTKSSCRPKAAFKFRIDRISSFEDIVIRRFCVKPRYVSHHALKSVQSFLLQATTRIKKEKERYKKSQSRYIYISRSRREAPCERILTKFRTSRDMADKIICVKFSVKELSGQRYMKVQTSVSPIEMAGHSYNSVVLLRSL